jgi:hypothetical protein
MHAFMDFFCLRNIITEMNHLTHSLQGAALFTVLSHPDVYRIVSRYTKFPVGSLGLVLVHAVVFFLVSLFATKLLDKGPQQSKSGPVPWFSS